MKCLYCIYKKRISGHDGEVYICKLIDESINWFRRLIGCKYFKSIIEKADTCPHGWNWDDCPDCRH